MRVILTILVLAICGAVFADYSPISAQTKIETNPDKIVYQFKDASVAPAYHRSYTITVTKSEAKIVVSDYDTALNEITVPLDKKRFDEIVRVVRDAKIRRLKSAKDNAGCTGGTGESIALFKNGKQSFSADAYHCGGDDYGDLAGNSAAVKAKLKSLFPKLEKTLK